MVLTLHIFLAVNWVGGVLFVGWAIFPVMKSVNPTSQQKFLIVLMKYVHPIFISLGTGVILTGILLGTVFGPINQFSDIYQSTYGLIWVSALLTALLTLAWGTWVGYKQMMKMLNDQTLWKMARKGYTLVLRRKRIWVFVVESVEVCGFVILIALMTMF